MPYSPLQPRGPDGRFIRKGAIGAATKGMTGAKAKVKKSKPRARRGDTGAGFRGLRANFTPYVRINKRSQTVGYNAGTLLPGTHRRVVTGQYVRLESTRNKTVADRFVAKGVNKVLPKGTRRGKIRAAASKVSVGAPLARGSYKGHQVRLGTSRGAGPTVIIRRGKHKTPPVKSAKGINAYNKRMGQIAGTRATAKAKRRKSRPQRRRAARKKK